MSWRKHFSPVEKSNLSPISGRSGQKAGPVKTNYSSFLPDIYAGSPNRIDRYLEFVRMDADPEVNAALDILAEFCTQKLKGSKSPFTINWRHKATNSEIKILGEYLQQWNRLQNFDTKIFRIVRNTFKFGDSFFIRDPENFKWYWVDPGKVIKVIVNESDGKKPEQYIIKDLAPNFEHLVATQLTTVINPRQVTGGAGAAYFSSGGTNRQTGGQWPSAASGSRFGLAETEYAINAEHVVHLSLSEGLDDNYPFGISLLENIFKVYKQKELLEDAVLIYRIHRAPERRVFHIDVGNMPSHMAMAFVERIKTELHQKRIPTSNGGCLAMDTKIPLQDGRTLTIEQLAQEHNQGKTNWCFSCNPQTGYITSGLITWAGVTQSSAEVIKLILDNGQTIVCTPDHKFPTFEGKIEAKDLKVNRDIVRGVKFDHKIVKIELLKDPITVGTLTIDGEEIYHNYHTFALDIDIFTYNSNIIDSGYNPLSIGEDYFFPKCLDLNTELKLLDGRTITLQQAMTEYNLGITNKILTINPNTLEFESGEIIWAGKTRLFAQLVEVKLSNNTSVRCTSDHKFILADGSAREAYELFCGDQIASVDQTIYVEKVNWINKRADTGDITIYSTNENHNFLLANGIFVHNSTEGRGSDVTTLPGGCFAMDTKIDLLDGRSLSIREIEDELRTRNSALWTYSCEPITGKVVPGLITWAGVTQSSAKVMKITLENNQEIVCTPDHKFCVRDQKFRSACELKAGDRLISFHTRGESHSKQYYDRSNLSWTSIYRLINQFLNQNNNHRSLLRPLRNQIPNFFTMIKTSIKNLWRDLLDELTAFYGDYNYQITADHSIKKIEFLLDPIEVGTLTIDELEIFHNHHTFALSAGVFVKNSNVGEINDLQYFTNKLFRGLRIPSSYLPTGAEDSQTAFNDGRVGTAYIQELRFNKYCERLQSLLIEEFDREFKIYIYNKGLNIDPNLFELEFNPPMNFASSRQAAVDAERINTFSTVQQLPYISKRFALKRYLGLTDEEIAENERMWAQETGKGHPTTTDAAGELRAAGLSAGGIEGDLGMAGNFEPPPELSDELGMEAEPTPAPGGAPPAAPPAPGPI